MPGPSQVKKNLRAAVKDALRIQSRFLPEPVYAKTGKGFLQSEGVETLLKIKANLRVRKGAESPCKKSG